MPTYEYRCTKCGNQFELFQGMNDKPRSRCPKCRGKVVRLIGGGAGFIFKGGGFYATDYRSSEYKKKSKEDKSSEKPEQAATASKKKSESAD